jgi:tetratricopeptide (TPR) repeat protein
MTPDDVERIFHEALDLPPEDRRAHIAQAFQGDDQLRSTVEALLDASERADHVKGWDSSALENFVGQTELDRYRLMERIGAGGMALVYKAVRADDEFSKLVAVKILLAPDPDLIERFRRERQMLALLEHPNIARLLDGGTSHDGAPFLVMEYVEGISVDRYIREKHLSLEDTLGLFRKICDAVSYAHRNLIVHRDLKPANILVTADGEPKLLDFGIAKLIDGTAERTKTGMGAMTPEYASPEQVRGGAITTATDVYSLGVILFELLTGARPYAQTTSALDLAEAIVSSKPLPVGTRFDDDLDNIVQMALRKEPERRYASVEQFSDDIRRYREGYPIAARASTRLYRLRKFAVRNRIALAAAALLAVTVTGGIIATLREARIANRRFDDVRSLAHSVLFDYHDAVAQLPGSVGVRQRLTKDGLNYLDRLSQEAGNDEGLILELASAYLKVGDVQGRAMRSNLGDIPGALQSYRKAVVLLEKLTNRHPSNEEAQEDLALAYDRFGQLTGETGDPRTGLANEQKAIEIFEKLCASGRYPSASKFLGETASTSQDRRAVLAGIYGDLARTTGSAAFSSLGDAAGAEPLYRKALALWETTPRNSEYLTSVGSLHSDLGGLFTNNGKEKEALAEYQKTLEIDLELANITSDPTSRRELAIAYHNVGVGQLGTRVFEPALKNFQSAGVILDQLVSADPKDFNIRITLADNTRRTGETLYRMERYQEALTTLRASNAMYAGLSERSPENQSLQSRRGTALLMMSILCEKIKDGSCTVDASSQAAKVYEAIHSDSFSQPLLARAYYQKGQGHRLMAHPREAQDAYRRSLEVWDLIQREGKLSGTNVQRRTLTVKALEEVRRGLSPRRPASR